MSIVLFYSELKEMLQKYFEGEKKRRKESEHKLMIEKEREGYLQMLAMKETLKTKDEGNDPDSDTVKGWCLGC